MKHSMRKIFAFILVLATVISMVGIPSFAEKDESAPKVSVALVPGEESVAKESYVGEGSTVIRKVTSETSELETIVSSMKNIGFKGPQSALKFDRNSKADQTAQSKARDLYADNGHFTDPATISVTDAPASHPFKYVGSGDYSGHYVSHIRVIYDLDENNNALKDENGNYIIKELQHSKGAPLTFRGEPTLNLEGPFDQTTGTRPSQFLLVNEEGNSIYAYCVDLDTPTADSAFYRVSNLEDADYYASEDAEAHIRAITQNGYWGTAEGEEGSLSKMKEMLKYAVASGAVESEYDITFVLRGAKYTEGAALAEGEYVGNGYISKTQTEHIVLTEDVIDGLTEGEALDAMQGAIWSFANGSNYNLNGVTRMIVGDVTYASCKLGDSKNGQNDFAGAARTKALYNYLISIKDYKDSTVVINDKTFIENMALTVGDHLGDDIYEASLCFTTYFNADVEKDDLTVSLTYVDANGATQTISKKLTGEDALVPDDNEFYVLEGLTLRAGEKFDFVLNVYGAQLLEKGTYIYISQGGIGSSQTMVGISEGTNVVDVKSAFSASFNVEENVVIHTVDVAGRKYWDDDDDAAGMRPESIKIYLYADGEKIDSLTVTEEDGWEWEFNNLPEYDGDNKIEYTIEEAAVKGYIATVDGYDIINTYMPETISVYGTKVWNDENDIDGIRPDYIVVQLQANGIPVDRCIVTEESGWSFSFHGLERYKNGREIYYSVYEIPVSGYSVEITGSAYTGYVITNTHVPAPAPVIPTPVVPEIPVIPNLPEYVPDPIVPLDPPVVIPEEKIPEVFEEILEEILEEDIPLIEAPVTSDDPTEETANVTFFVVLVSTVFVCVLCGKMSFER